MFIEKSKFKDCTEGNGTFIATPKSRTRKAHPEGQTAVPATRNRARAKTTNIPTI